MDRVFDPHAWSSLKTFLGHGESSSSSTSETLRLPKRQKQETFNLKQISEHVFELSRNPERPSAEIIFFHGLQVDSSKEPYITTWLSKDGSQLWLNWLLEEFPDVRVLVVSYDASIMKTDNHGRLDMYLTCENLVQELMGKRKAPVGETRCPIILVGHCLGGLVLKELCVKVSHRTMTEEDDCFKNFFQSVKGVFCYSSPHHGSEFPDCNTLRARGALFEDLNPLNAKTARQNEDFRKLRNKQKWRSAGVGESLEVTLSNFKGLVVPEGSSRHDVDTYYTINADHFDVCRPDSPNSTSYSMLADLVDQIIKKDKGSMVSNSDLPDILVGFDSCIEAVQYKLSTESRIALVGMGGVGKSTLARAVYERIQKSFDYSCFFREVKTSMEAKVTPQELRNKIQKQFVDRGGKKVPEGFSWNLLEGKKVLIVLDDIISKEQLKVMTPKDGFSIGSRLIITARGRGFIETANLGFCIHPVKVLDRDSSKKLLCSYAFGEEESPIHFSEHVEKIVTKCGGLPLALTITGGFLFSKRKPEWEDAFKRLQAAEGLNGDAEDGLFSLLKISYDSLAKREKEMFLDAATCFHGKDLEEVLEAWKYCGWADDIGWGNLLEKNLVEKQENKIFVHEVLRDLGRSIAGRSRMLVSNLSELSNEDANAVKVVSGHMDDFDGSLLYRFSKLKVLWLDDEGYESDWSDESDESHESHERDEGTRDNQSQAMESISSMSTGSSTLTEISVVSLSGIEDVSILRSIFTMKSLQFLKLKLASRRREENIPTTLWAEIGNLQRLQALYIGTCCALHQIPVQINKLQSLQSLEIIDCENLKAIPVEIGQLKNLQSLSFSRCSNLGAIPPEIGQLKNLQSLDISGCTSLGAIPTEIGRLKNLQSLDIRGCSSLEAITGEIGQLKNLQSLHIRACSGLEAIPAEIGQLKNLQSLDISGCFSLGAIPAEIGQLKNLQSLYIWDCSSLITIPTEIGQLKNLQSLHIRGCSSLGAIPAEIGQLKNLQSLDIRGCSSLGAITAEIGQLKNLQLLDIWHCSSLITISTEIGHLKNLQSLNIRGCSSLGAIPVEIGQLKNLQSLNISGCSSLETIPAEIGHLKNLQSLDIRYCSNLEALPKEIGQLKNLQSLNICDCFSLEAIPIEIGQLKNLQTLYIWDCSSLIMIPAEIGQLKNLQSLQIRGCSSLGVVPTEIGQLKNLQSLDIRGCSSLVAITAEIAQLENLQSLDIWHCSSLITISTEIGQLKNLQSLHIKGCSSLRAIPVEIGQLKNLQSLDISGCSNLGVIPAEIGQLKNL